MSSGEYPEDVSYEDAAKIGFQVVEMCDRVSPLAACLPGTKAVWHFEMDDRRFQLTVAPAPRPEPDVAG